MPYYRRGFWEGLGHGLLKGGRILGRGVAYGAGTLGRFGGLALGGITGGLLKGPWGAMSGSTAGWYMGGSVGDGIARQFGGHTGTTVAKAIRSEYKAIKHLAKPRGWEPNTPGSRHEHLNYQPALTWDRNGGH
jgi:hypothetical protein